MSLRRLLEFGVLLTFLMFLFGLMALPVHSADTTIDAAYLLNHWLNFAGFFILPVLIVAITRYVEYHHRHKDK